MLGYTEKMRDIAGRLLKECTVDMVIGAFFEETTGDVPHFLGVSKHITLP